MGHQRDTKTKGIWVWGEPMEVDVNGVTTSVLFLDTEGFESVRKSSVYDDRCVRCAALCCTLTWSQGRGRAGERMGLPPQCPMP